MVSSPALAAQEEIMNLLEQPQVKVGFLSGHEQVEELWRIDCQAYNHPLTIEGIVKWWSAYPQGSMCLFSKGRIVASIGIYPLSAQQANQFVNGEILEESLQPLSSTDTDTWYVSGCVVIPDCQNKGLLRPLLRLGFGKLLSSNLPDRVRLLSLGETPIGCKILKRTGFSSIKPASQMPDGSELFERVCTPEQLKQTVKGF